MSGIFDKIAAGLNPNPPETYGPWDWGKKSLAVVTCRNGEGSVLWWVGGHIDFELSEAGMVSLGDLGLDNAPDGLSIWEGVYDYHRDQSYFHDDGGWTEANGDFRRPTEEEWEWIKSNQCPWDAIDWMEPDKMQVSVGRIVHYRPTPEQGDLWTKDGNPITEETVLPAIVVAVWDDNKVNMRVFTDGSSMPWVTSVEEGEARGSWGWPPRV
jgi:hypothetical protein